MPNTLLTPSVIARTALATLYANAVMPQLVWRDFDADFAGKVGDTVTVRKPAVFTSNTFDRATGITLQDATETGLPVTLDTLLDVSFAVTSEDLALKVESFQEQFLAPAMEAHAQKLDQMLIGLKSSVAQSVGTSSAGGASGQNANAPTVLVDAGKVLNDAKVPMSERRAVLNTGDAANFLKDPLFNRVDESGSTAGLQEASIGRKFGFDTYVDQNLTYAQADGGDSLAFHRTAFALVSRTLPKPQGAAQSAVANYKGFGLRVVYDYDINKKQDVVSIDCLVGVKVIDPNRACLILS